MNDIPTMPSEPGEATAQELADVKTPLAEAAETVSRTASENIGLTLIGGLAVGLAVGALLPAARRKKKPKKAARALMTTLAASITELSQTLAAQARDRAEAASEDARERLSAASETVGKTLHEQTESLSRQTRKLAEEAAGQLNDGGKALARTVIKLVEKVRH